MCASHGTTLVPLERSWHHLSENLYHHTQKNEPFIHEMHLMIRLL
jgi:hypothetical protein